MWWHIACSYSFLLVKTYKPCLIQMDLNFVKNIFKSDMKLKFKVQETQTKVNLKWNALTVVIELLI